MQDNPLSLLDNIRASNGKEDAANFYRRLLQSDPNKALELVNDPNMKFGTLYHLRSVLSKTELEGRIRPLCRNALQIARLLPRKGKEYAGALLRPENEASAAALRWMVTTGCGEIDLGSDYDRLMEQASALLTKQLDDPYALPFITERIFRLNRIGKPVHDLVWAFFEAKRPESLLLLAQRLDSGDGRDVELSKRLLCFIPLLENPAVPTGNSSLSERTAVWLQENLPFLQYTGESLHLSGKPKHYRVCLSAKYLCRPVSAEAGEAPSEWNPFERQLLEQFQEMPETAGRLLADFSWTLYRSNFQKWIQWIQLPTASQASIAANISGGYA